MGRADYTRWKHIFPVRKALITLIYFSCSVLNPSMPLVVLIAPYLSNSFHIMLSEITGYLVKALDDCFNKDLPKPSRFIRVGGAGYARLVWQLV